MTKRMAAALAALCLGISAAEAGESCEGIIHVGSEWTNIAGSVGNGDYNAVACKFQTKSAVGKRILKICPDGSRCEILPDDLEGIGDEYGNGLIVKTITKVWKK